MAEFKRVYRCNVCGNIVVVVHSGQGTLVCCGQPMELLKENSVEASLEKHVPVIEGKKVKIGSVEHPMEEKHYIEWIWASNEEHEDFVFLKPGMKPEAEFCFQVKEAKAYCNLHGLWKK
jgi:superoxide reductase